MSAVTVSRRWSGETVSVALSGELDISGVLDVERELRIAEQEEPHVIVLDLRALDFIDSTGLRMVIAVDERARRDGRRLVIVPGPEPVQRVFRMTLLDKRLEFVETPEFPERADDDRG